ncbi:MAG: alkaline phosphatase [Firmicutes bacterium]|nr:alkaline phosphatase [Bacillota bacterium]
MNRQGRAICLALSVCILVTLSSGFSLAAAGAVKNVIVLVPDGCGSTHTTLARWYKGSPLALDEVLTGGVKTYAAESLITDSAPAATAFATGYKSNSKFVSVLPEKVTIPGLAQQGDPFKPVATVLEGAKLAGKATGIVATSNIQHATPAAFSSHNFNRNDYNDIAEQQVYQGMDVVLGGGKKYLLPKSAGGARTDNEDLVQVLRSMGYDIVENTGALMNSSASRIWGMFAGDAMAYDMDRDPAKEPSLAQMTQKAIEVLSKDPDGFFLFVEGSEVDWASHANDPVGVIGDVLAFDAAVMVALDFAKKDGQTLVVAFTDHGNGGMSIGSKQSDHNYDRLPYSAVLDLLKKAKISGQGLEARLSADRSNIIEAVAQYYGITDLKPEEIEAIRTAKPGSMNYAVGPIISGRCNVGWTTTGHSGEDVFLYSYGPSKITGLVENAEIAAKVAEAMGFSLNDLNSKMFVKARPAFEALGAKVDWNNIDAANPVLVVEKGNVKAELPVSKNVITINGGIRYMKGLTVFSRGTTFVPREALDLFAAVAK